MKSLGVVMFSSLSWWSCGSDSETLVSEQQSRISPLLNTELKLWPVPTAVDSSSETCHMSRNFKFQLANNSSRTPLISEAIDRFTSDLSVLLAMSKTLNESSACESRYCDVLVEDDEIVDWFTDPVQEYYEIKFKDPAGCWIFCKSVFGCMHGMKTFIQFIEPMNSNSIPSNFNVTDIPQFPHRGLLIDTSRRFLSPDVIKLHIDMMSATKLNVLHWHLVDDFGFSVSLPSFPELASKGAISQYAIYTPATVRELIAYARARGVIIMPELDIPGHSSRWFLSHPELMGIAENGIDPTRPETYEFLKLVIADTVDLFQTNVIHLGGDELYDAWSTAAINVWMKSNSMYSHSDLVHYWLTKMNDIAKDLNITVIMWEDFLPLVKAWSGQYTHIKWQMWMRSSGETAAVALPNKVFSTDFYLDHIDKNWVHFYEKGRDFAKNANGNIAGGEACMWGEWVDDTNILQRTWPRAAAIAETLWSHPDNTQGGFGTALLRLVKWRCRMMEFFGYKFIEPLGQVTPSNPEIPMTWGTDQSQWWCPETDFARQQVR